MLQISLLQSKHTHHSNYGMQKADFICFVNRSEMHRLSNVLEVLTVTAWHASVWKRKDKVKKRMQQKVLHSLESNRVNRDLLFPALPKDNL